jgi:hypothetical protein
MMYKTELFFPIKLPFAGHFPTLESLAHQSSSLIPNSHLILSFVYSQTVVLARGTANTNSRLTPPLQDRPLFCHALSTLTPLRLEVGLGVDWNNKV